MSREIRVDKQKLNQLVSSLYTARSSGATIPHPNNYPQLLNDVNVLQRNGQTNVFLGTIISNPSTGRYVLGSSYYDLKENKHNEDLINIDTVNGTIEPFYRGQLSQQDPLYVDTHKASKKYLITPVKQVEIIFKKIKFRFLLI